VNAPELPALLRRLHAELDNATSLDQESKQLLAMLARDLQKFESHMSATRSFALRFEAQHPSVAAVLRQIADMFGKAGI